MARGRRGRARGGGRGRKAVRVISSDEEQEKETSPDTKKDTEKSDNPGQSEATIEQMETEDSEKSKEVETNKSNTDNNAAKKDENEPVKEVDEEIRAPTIDMEADISQLEAPTFTTISRGPPEPMLHLEWNHKVNLIGEKVINPMIHCCDQCEKPILIYGRMIPCKHVFCLKCARNETLKVCPRCKEKAIRVEQTGLGTVFMCTHGGTRYESRGCRRTYLSQRDLQAHINHRHVNAPAVARLESLGLKLNDPDKPNPIAATQQKKPLLENPAARNILTQERTNRPPLATNSTAQPRSNPIVPESTASSKPSDIMPPSNFFSSSSSSSQYFNIPAPRYGQSGSSAPTIVPGLSPSSAINQTTGSSNYFSSYSGFSNSSSSLNQTSTQTFGSSSATQDTGSQWSQTQYYR